MIRSRGVLAVSVTLPVVMWMTADGGHAQVLYGSPVGSVNDPTATAIPNATADVTNQGTGRQRTTTTGGLGAYALTSLPPGVYELAISAQGFPQLRLREGID